MKTTPDPEKLITYDEALAEFKSANLCTNVRTVKRKLAKHRRLCPVVSEGYHYKRVRLGDVRKLVAHLAAKANPNRKPVVILPPLESLRTKPADFVVTARKATR